MAIGVSEMQPFRVSIQLDTTGHFSDVTHDRCTGNRPIALARTVEAGTRIDTIPLRSQDHRMTIYRLAS
jgi:hypothetical protein